MADSKKKILIIEDDFYIKDLYAIESRAAGFEVETASDGEEALVKIKSVNPDLLILDIMLPKMDGISVLKQVKQDPVHSKIPVIIITNLEDPAKEQEAKSLGAKEYLLKIRTNPTELIEKVKGYI